MRSIACNNGHRLPKSIAIPMIGLFSALGWFAIVEIAIALRALVGAVI